MSENSALLGQISILTGLSGFIVNLDLGWLDTYLKAVVLGAAGLLWIEFLAQWPRELVLAHHLKQGHVVGAQPRGVSWRLTTFAYLMPVIVILFMVWAITKAPEVVIPVLAIGIALVVWRAIERQGGHWLLLVVLMAAAFALSEFALESIFPHKQTLVDVISGDVIRFTNRR